MQNQKVDDLTQSLQLGVVRCSLHKGEGGGKKVHPQTNALQSHPKMWSQSFLVPIEGKVRNTHQLGITVTYSLWGVNLSSSSCGF